MTTSRPASSLQPFHRSTLTSLAWTPARLVAARRRRAVATPLRAFTKSRRQDGGAPGSSSSAHRGHELRSGSGGIGSPRRNVLLLARSGAVKSMKRSGLQIACFASLLTAIALATPSLARATECPNEQLRHESNINPTTHEPYDLQLPECRAYEMVSPGEKGNSDVQQFNGGLPAAADGNAIAWASQNAFAGAEAADLGPLGIATDTYISRRTPLGWSTTSALPPLSLIGYSGNNLDLEPTMFGAVASCGVNIDANSLHGAKVACARQQSGEWGTSASFDNSSGAYFEGQEPYPLPQLQGASVNLSTLVFQTRGGPEAGAALLPEDVSDNNGDGLYALTEPGSTEQMLRLINVTNGGQEIGPNMGSRIGGIGSSAGGTEACSAYSVEEASSSYQAISQDGLTVFFTACPSNTSGAANEIFARLNGAHTVDISDPAEEGASECDICNPTPQSAAFEGASADGAKAFFITTQPLVPGDTDSTMDLYMYYFGRPAGENLVQLSYGSGEPGTTKGNGAEVQGVVRTSADGSRAYFIARGVLTKLPNYDGEAAQAGADNLYGVNTNTGETHFVAKLCSGASESGTIVDSACPTGEGVTDAALWGSDQNREAQVTSNGQYLVFSTYAHLLLVGSEAQATTDKEQQVYRYDFSSGRLVRISVGEPSYPQSENNNGSGSNALIHPPLIDRLRGADGALAAINDYSRAISNNGGIVLFSIAGQLQTAASGQAPKVYEWHECSATRCPDGMAGEVALISPGGDTNSSSTEDGLATMSESGENIFFFTRVPLVEQDQDELVDVYDARVNGGFPAPTPEASCSGEECQGTPSNAPEALGGGGSSTATASGNLTPTPFVVKAVEEQKPAEAGAVKITSHSSNSLSVSTTSGGTLSLSGTGLATEKKTAAKSGTYTLPLTLTSAEKKLLTKRGHLTLTVTVRFTPTSGKASTAKEKITIQSQPKQKPKSKKKSKKK